RGAPVLRGRSARTRGAPRSAWIEAEAARTQGVAERRRLIEAPRDEGGQRGVGGQARVGRRVDAALGGVEHLEQVLVVALVDAEVAQEPIAGCASLDHGVDPGAEGVERALVGA